MKTLGALLLALFSHLASADVRARDVWVRVTPPGTTVSAVYADIVSTKDDELLSVATSAAERVEFHSTTDAGGTMKMRPLKTVALPANQHVRFEPSGLHMMLVGLRAPLQRNTNIELTLHLRHAGEVKLKAEVFSPLDLSPPR